MHIDLGSQFALYRPGGYEVRPSDPECFADSQQSCSVRSTNVYEEKSLGIYHDEDDDVEEGFEIVAQLDDLRAICQ